MHYLYVLFSTPMYVSNNANFVKRQIGFSLFRIGNFTS